MPLTGALQADFSDFVAEAQKASAALGVMDAEAKKTGTTLAKTGAAVDGFGSAADKSAGGLTQISSGLRMMDASANAAGVSLAKPIHMIEEIAQVSGQTTTSLGALGTAGAVAGAALAGWNVGRWIADLTGADAIVARLTANLMGWSDAEQVAGLNADILAKASATAGRAITDLTEARKINYEAVKQHTAAVDTAIHRQALWEREIRKHRAELPEITAALDNHTASTKQLEQQYGMSAEAITYYVNKTKDKTAADRDAAAETQRAADAQAKLQAQMFGTDSITKAQEYQAALGGISNLTRMTQEEQTKLNTVVGEAIEAYKRAGTEVPPELNKIYTATVSIGTVTTGLGSEWANVGTKVDTSITHIITKLTDAQQAAAAYEAETQNQVQAYIDMQYGAEGATRKVDETTAATQRLTVAMADFGRTNRSAWESMQAGEELMQAYRDAGIFVGQQVATGGYQQQLRQRAGRELPTDITGGAAWGNTLNVNVNSTDAQDIAGKLVSEMSRQGVRF